MKCSFLLKQLIAVIFVALPFLGQAQAPNINPADYSNLAGLWTFDNTDQILDASIGNDLVLHGSHQSIPGPEAGNYAINIGAGSYYTCYHDIAGNGGGSEVNEYSMVIDFRIPQSGQWYCFYQTNENNNNDGDLFVNTSNQIGRSTNGPGYTSYQVTPGEWYRMVVSADLGNDYKVYLDGNLVLAGGSLSIDGEYSLYPANDENLLHFFLDDNGEDNSIDIALVGLFNDNIDANTAAELGGYGHEIQPILTGILPYLQTPTPSSMYVSWHSNNTGSTLVEYGTSENLELSQTGTVEDISGKKWHTVKLSGLSPDTEYFYKCISEDEESEINKFRTPAQGITQNGHFRFLIFGDSRTDEAKTTEIAYAAKNKVAEMFGGEIQNQINVVIHVGDIVTSGTSIDQYPEEYFTPYACLSANLPFMVAIGNHENEAVNYYDYMKYEDFSDYGSLLNEKFYSFYLSNIQFLMLNSNTTLMNSIQTNWIEEKLSQSEASNETNMVFAFLHHPGHSELWPDGNNSYVQNDVIPTLQQYPKTQLLAYGHSHNYERGTIESLAENNNGDYYIMLTGGAGSGLDRWGMYPNQTNYSELMMSLDHYCFNIVDIDLNAKTMELYTFSLGHLDKPLDCVLVDQYHRYLLQEAPETPLTLSPNGETGLQPLLVASEMIGADSLMTSHFQITTTPGDYSNLIAESKRDWVDIYGDTGAPDYLPTNLNQGIDLKRFQLSSDLTAGTTYAWRVRYRDHNQKWSEWSEEQTFTVSENTQANTDFTADITEGIVPFNVHFTDLSFPAVTTWSWDFDADASIDATIQDPEFIYTQEGIFTVSLTTEHGTTTKDLYINAETNTVQEIENKTNDLVRIYPNPFYESSDIEFVLQKPEYVIIKIINNKGQEISILNNGNMPSGKHSIHLKAYDNSGKKLAPGKYFLKFQAGEITEIKSLIITEK